MARSAPEMLGSVDSHGRALAKAITWRVVGTLDTFLWSWVFTGHAGKAGAIASAEIVTKIALYYLHERAWRLIRWAPNARLRSATKAVSWRVVGSLDTFGLSFLFTRDLGASGMIALAEVLTKIILYYLHERAWRRVPWGRLEDPAQKAEAPAHAS